MIVRVQFRETDAKGEDKTISHLFFNVDFLFNDRQSGCHSFHGSADGVLDKRGPGWCGWGQDPLLGCLLVTFGLYRCPLFISPVLDNLTWLAGLAGAANETHVMWIRKQEKVLAWLTPSGFLLLRRSPVFHNVLLLFLGHLQAAEIQVENLDYHRLPEWSQNTAPGNSVDSWEVGFNYPVRPAEHPLRTDGASGRDLSGALPAVLLPP